MKRSQLFRYIMMLVAACFTASVFSQSSQHALYNYRNDGDFNAWLNDDIEKITYSCVDTLGVEHDDIVVQEVWTADTVYRIPLEAIDSIGFRAPKPEMREGLFYLRDYHAEHTSAVDTFVLYFDTSIHKDSIPSVGQTIICATDATPYEEGFAGKVTEIRNEDNQIAIHCEEAAVGDIFKRLVLVGKASTEVEEKEESKSRTRNWWNEPALNLQDDGIIPIQLEEQSFEILEGMNKIKSPAPKLTCRYYVYVSELYYEIFAQADIVHKDLTYTLDVSTNKLRSLKEDGEFFLALTSEERLDEWLEKKFKKSYKEFLKEEKEQEEINAEKEITKRIWKTTKVDIPIIGNGVFNLSLMLAPLFKIKGNIEAISEFKTDAIQSLSMKIKGYTPLPRSGYISDFSASHKQDPIKSAKLDMKITGGITLGFVGLLNVNLVHRNVLYAGVGGELGMDLAGSLNVTLLDDQQPEMNMYDRLKDTKLKLCYYANVYPEVGITPLDILHLSGSNWDLTTWDVFSKEYTFYMMPHFTEPALPKFSNKTWSYENPLGFYSTASKDIFFPCKVGMRITDTDGNVVKEYLDSKRYLEEYEWLNNPLNIDISDLSKGVSYKCYPTISFFGLNAFNAGPVHNFSVPLPMVASPKELILPIGGSNTVTFLGGWDTFAVVVSGEEGIASIKKDETGVRHITVVGNKKGTAVLRIEDRRTGEVLNIPITVTDEPIAQSTISIDTEEINFGNVFVGNSKTKQFKVSNTGEHNLTFSVSKTHGEFEIAESGKEFTLGPKEEKTFDVVYTPAKEDISSDGTITITSDAENNSSWTITLTGTGRSKGAVNLSVGLVAYYPFIGNANDVTGNGNNGTPKTNVTLTTGVEGDENGAYQFGGYSNPGHIYIPNSESLKFSEGVSFSAYIKPLSWVSMDGWGSRTTSGGLQCIMAKDHDRYGITLAFSGNDNGCRFWTHNMCNQKWSELSSGDQLKGNYLNKWTHVAYVFGDGYARLYVDGMLMDEREATPDFSTINSRDLYIGKFSDSWYPFNGVIDEVRIYNRTLTPAEVERLAVFHDDL